MESPESSILQVEAASSSWKKPIEPFYRMMIPPPFLESYPGNPSKVPLPSVSPREISSGLEDDAVECDTDLLCRNGEDESVAGPLTQLWEGAFEGELDTLYFALSPH